MIFAIITAKLMLKINHCDHDTVLSLNYDFFIIIPNNLLIDIEILMKLCYTVFVNFVG